jgi:hypothetical protein
MVDFSVGWNGKQWFACARVSAIMSWDKFCCLALRHTIPWGVCGVTIRLWGVSCLRCELGVECGDINFWRDVWSGSSRVTLGGETVVRTLWGVLLSTSSWGVSFFSEEISEIMDQLLFLSKGKCPTLDSSTRQCVLESKVTTSERHATSRKSPTPLRTYSSTAFGILNETIKQRRSTAMDMIYYWLTNRVRQKQFDVYRRPGRENLGDYHTKHHSAQHHKDMHGLILNETNSLQVLRGCVKLLPLPQPSLRARTDVRTNPSAQRATSADCGSLRRHG